MVRFWSAESGLDEAVIDALRSRRLDQLTVVEPPLDVLAEQLRAELAASRIHLDKVLDGYWDRGWRRDRKGCGEGPEDYLWRAATAVREIEEALADLSPDR